MLRILVLSVMGIAALSVGLMVWQTDFAEKEAESRWHPPVRQPDHEGVPQTITDNSPVAGQVIATVQKFFRAPERTPDKPTVNRGGYTNREGFDIRYTKRPGG